MSRFLRAGAVTAALLAVGAVPAAASLDSAGTTIAAFSDTHMTPLASTAPLDLTLIRVQYCAAKGHGAKMSLRQALRLADHLVSADSHGRGLKSFSRSSDGRSEKRSLAAAAGTLGAGKPAAALAALLRAHKLAPHDPVPLIDAAPLLSDAGQGGAALALLDAAGRLKAPKTHPFGISWKAIAANNRGQALIVAHKYRAAASSLGKALKAAPLLREAEQNLAVVDACRGEQRSATHMLFLAARRQQFPAQDYVDTSTEDPFGQLDDSHVLDTSRGVKLTLPTLNFPRTMDAGVRQQKPNFNLQQDLVQNQEPAANAQLARDQTALDTSLTHANPATAQRTQEIVAAPVYTLLAPRLRSMYNKALNLQEEMGQLQERGENQAGCANAGLHGQWLSTLQAYDTAQRRYAAAEYRMETGMAANVKNPLAHQLMLDQAKSNAISNFFLLVAEEGFLDSYDFICDRNDVKGSMAPDKGEAQMPASPACPTGLTGPGFTLNLLVFAFSVTCEEVKGRLTLGEGWLNGFVSASHNFRTGSSTIFAGPQVGANISAGPFKGGVSARGGVYVTFGADGAVQDVGVRAETGAGVKISGVGDSISGPNTSISIAGAFAPPI